MKGKGTKIQSIILFLFLLERRMKIEICFEFQQPLEYILCNVCNGKTDSSLNFDIFGLEKATNQLQTPDKASYLDFSSGL